LEEVLQNADVEAGAVGPMGADEPFRLTGELAHPSVKVFNYLRNMFITVWRFTLVFPPIHGAAFEAQAQLHATGVADLLVEGMLNVQALIERIEDAGSDTKDGASW
jgi:hypothetical protein